MRLRFSHVAVLACVAGLPCAACGGLLGVDFSDARAYDDGGATDATDASVEGGAITPTARAIAVAAGNAFACAIVEGGSVKCWGDNQHGQLGNASAGVASVAPVAVESVAGATAITAGAFHACALLAGGAVTCWGENGSGQLGTGLDLGASYTSIAAGVDHTCALGDGQVQCWGANTHGQLGSSAASGTLSHVALTGVAQIAAGAEFSCALLAAGNVQCWGWNQYKTLGSASSTFSNTPISVSGLSATGVAAIGAGDNHACAVLGGGAVQCWGENLSGELGVDTGASPSGPVAVSGLPPVSRVYAGGDLVGPVDHSCAVTSGGGVLCWGANSFGELGNVQSSSGGPTPVGVEALASNVESLALGGGFSCALTTDGVVWCWGSGAIGPNQPANGESPAPVQVTGL